MKNILLIFITVILLSACSDGTEENANGGESYETQSAEIGHNAAQSIKVPMDKAENAVDLENERLREYEKSLSEE